MRKPLRQLSDIEKIEFVTERRARRAIKTKGEAKLLSVGGLSKAWGVSVIELEKKLLTLDLIKDKVVE